MRSTRAAALCALCLGALALAPDARAMAVFYRNEHAPSAVAMELFLGDAPLGVDVTLARCAVAGWWWAALPELPAVSAARFRYIDGAGTLIYDKSADVHRPLDCTSNTTDNLYPVDRRVAANHALYVYHYGGSGSLPCRNGDVSVSHVINRHTSQFLGCAAPTAFYYRNPAMHADASVAAVRLDLYSASSAPLGSFTLSRCTAFDEYFVGHVLPPASPPDVRVAVTALDGSNGVLHIDAASCSSLQPYSGIDFTRPGNLLNSDAGCGASAVTQFEGQFTSSLDECASASSLAGAQTQFYYRHKNWWASNNVLSVVVRVTHPLRGTTDIVLNKCPTSGYFTARLSFPGAPSSDVTLLPIAYRGADDTGTVYATDYASCSGRDPYRNVIRFASLTNLLKSSSDEQDEDDDDGEDDQSTLPLPTETNGNGNGNGNGNNGNGNGNGGNNGNGNGNNGNNGNGNNGNGNGRGGNGNGTNNTCGSKASQPLSSSFDSSCAAVMTTRIQYMNPAWTVTLPALAEVAVWTYSSDGKVVYATALQRIGPACWSGPVTAATSTPAKQAAVLVAYDAAGNVLAYDTPTCQSTPSPGRTYVFNFTRTLTVLDSANGRGCGGSVSSDVVVSCPLFDDVIWPTQAPSDGPTGAPSTVPTTSPSGVIPTPSNAPTDAPTDAPTESPTDAPTEQPTDEPTDEPTETPTDEPAETPRPSPTSDGALSSAQVAAIASTTVGIVLLVMLALLVMLMVKRRRLTTSVIDMSELGTGAAPHDSPARLYEAARTQAMAQGVPLLAYRDARGCGLLHYAAMVGDSATIQRLLGPNSTIYVDQTPRMLHVAIDASDTQGNTALLWAAQAGHVAAASVLLSYGANVSSCNARGETALHLACRQGHNQMAIFLAQNGALVNARDSEGRTPLYSACLARASAVPVLNFLVRGGADANLPDNTNTTPLMAATMNGNDAVFNFLFTQGVQVDDANLHAGNTALHWAAATNNKNALHQLLSVASPIPITRPLRPTAALALRQILELNGQNKRGETALFLAAREGHERAVQMLLQSKADASIPDNQGRTPLDVALANQQQKVVAILRAATRSMPPPPEQPRDFGSRTSSVSSMRPLLSSSPARADNASLRALASSSYEPWPAPPPAVTDVVRQGSSWLQLPAQWTTVATRALSMQAAPVPPALAPPRPKQQQQQQQQMQQQQQQMQQHQQQQPVWTPQRWLSTLAPPAMTARLHHSAGDAAGDESRAPLLNKTSTPTSPTDPRATSSSESATVASEDRTLSPYSQHSSSLSPGVGVSPSGRNPSELFVGHVHADIDMFEGLHVLDTQAPPAPQPEQTEQTSDELANVFLNNANDSLFDNDFS